jgi:hypothetical protein
MQPGVYFRVTDKNELVVVEDAAPPAILPFGRLPANERYLRVAAVHCVCAGRQQSAPIEASKAAIRYVRHTSIRDIALASQLRK